MSGQRRGRSTPDTRPHLVATLSQDVSVQSENENLKHFRPLGIDLDKWPRIAVTPSMLCAYACMKGENPDHKNDVLHSALFPGKSRRIFRHRVWLPISKSESISIDDPPGSALHYWDPVTHVEIPVQPGVTEEILLGIRDRPSSPPSASFAEYICRHPAPMGLDQYKGKDVFANFGYLEVNKTWVDPDSEGQLHNAYIKDGVGAKALYRAYLQERAEARGFPLFAKISGDGIMTPELEDTFYKDFVDCVSDNIDGEGDPRPYRISPATFARWAVGSRLPKPKEGVAVPPMPKEAKPKTTGIEKIVPSRKIKRKAQFDMDTGSIMSGIYSVENEPSLLEEPEGIDPVRPPHNFNMMNPQAARELQRQAYGPAWGDQYQRGIVQKSSIASNPGRFTSEEGMVMLARPENPDTGIREYYRTKGIIKALELEAQQGIKQNYETYVGMEAAGTHRNGLEREVQFLKHLVYQKKSQRNPPSSEQEDHEDSDDSMLNDSFPSPFTIRQARRRKEYKRQLAEVLSTQAIEVARTRVVQVRLRSEMDDILRDIHKLTKVKEMLLEAIGVKKGEDIPNLFPKRQLWNRNLRTEFNQQFQGRT